jgi:hypothetical protein
VVTHEKIQRNNESTSRKLPTVTEILSFVQNSWQGGDLNGMSEKQWDQALDPARSTAFELGIGLGLSLSGPLFRKVSEGLVWFQRTAERSGSCEEVGGPVERSCETKTDNCQR